MPEVTTPAQAQKPLPVGGQNPLRLLSPRSLERWVDWKTAWDRAQPPPSFEERQGLLHELQVNNWPLYHEEIISFLLELADGYDSHNFGLMVDGKHGQDNLEKNRLKLAQKASQILCLKFFKNEGRDLNGFLNTTPYWWWALENNGLFQKILWFLRPTEQYSGHNYRLQENAEHPQDIFQKFVAKFIKVGWVNYNEYHANTDHGPSEEVKNRLEAARPQLIELAERANLLRWIGHRELDAVCLQKLVGMAMERGYKFPDCEYAHERKPKNLQEAVWAGSVAAEVVMMRNVRDEVQADFDRQTEQERRRREEEGRQEQLAAIARKQEQLAQKAKELLQPQ